MSYKRKINPNTAEVASVKLKRNGWTISHNKKMTMRVGKLYPFFFEQMVPGDTMTLNTSMLAQMPIPPIHPVVDKAYFDCYYFAVPWLFVWDDCNKHFGESDTAGAIVDRPRMQKLVPNSSDPETAVGKFSPLHGFGIPKGYVPKAIDETKPGQNINAILCNMYLHIKNEFFRDENYEPKCVLTRSGDLELEPHDVASDPYLSNGTNKLQNVLKLHDYFIDTIPFPQKGASVLLPLVGSGPIDSTGGATPFPSGGQLRLSTTNPSSQTTTAELLGFQSSASSTDHLIQTFNNADQTPSTGQINGTNLVATIDKGSTTINDLRLAVQTQRMYELDAIYGTRYYEYIYAHFGVDSPDNTQRRPIFIGGSRAPVQISTIPQTSGTTSDSAQGNLAGVGKFGDNFKTKTYSATEHTMIIGVCCVRTQQTYSQGIDRKFFESDHVDHYDPLFSNIGYQPVYGKELLIGGMSKAYDEESVISFREPWNEYRHKPNQISGDLAPTFQKDPAGRNGDWIPSDMDFWLYNEVLNPSTTDGFAITADFKTQGENEFMHTLAYTADDAIDPILIDLQIDNHVVRPLPIRSVPGMLDHNAMSLGGVV